MLEHHVPHTLKFTTTECLFGSKAIAKFGSAASLVANPLLLGCFDIVFLATGTISFDKLTPVQQTQFIMLV